MNCSPKFFAPTTTRRSPPARHSGAVAAARPRRSTTSAPIARPRRRVASPRSTSPIKPSTASASPAAATQPARTSDQLCVCSPAKIRSPRLAAPTVVDSVAAPIVQVAAVLRPAIATGAASGASTSRSFCDGVIPTASAASITAGSIPCRPATPFRSSGSSA